MPLPTSPLTITVPGPASKFCKCSLVVQTAIVAVTTGVGAALGTLIAHVNGSDLKTGAEGGALAGFGVGALCVCMVKAILAKPQGSFQPYPSPSTLAVSI